MVKKITNITVTYSDGTKEIVSKPFTSILSDNIGDHITLEGFLKELFHDWDKAYALEQLDNEWQDKLREQLNASNNSQRAIIKGQQVQKLFPLLQFNYNIGDMIPVFNTMDFITLVGQSNSKIDKLIIQEVKTGQSQLNNKQKLLRTFIETLNHPKIKFELWRQSAIDKPFKIIEHRNRS